MVKLTWDVNRHNTNHDPFVVHMHILFGRFQAEVHKHALRGNANGVQDEEGVVSVSISMTFSSSS